MMRALILLHRWLGVAFCLLFAMWFASGIVMHFVPFPALTEAERFAGLAPIDLAAVRHGPAEAARASGIGHVTRIRLVERSDGPIYLVSGTSAARALRAADLADAAVRSEQLARAIAGNYARNRHFEKPNADIIGLINGDQWTVSQRFDRHRPLYKVALGDDFGTELYISTTTGEVVQQTTRRERVWNYLGSIAHWIYPTTLRSHPAEWSLLVWWLSLLALIGAAAGAAIGVLRLGAAGSRFLSPYRGWYALHHWLGVATMSFVLTWTFSGWLSMDNGRLFSSSRPSAAEAAAVAGAPAWNALPPDEVRRVGPQTREVEWFAFDGRIHRRERIEPNIQRLTIADPGADGAPSAHAFLERDELNAIANRLAPACKAPAIVDAGDSYAPAPNTPDAPVFRLVCGDDWFHIDGSSGALLEKLDSSRRAYRWLYQALHTFDIPALTERPALRTALIVTLCGCGFVFSLTSVVIASRRLLSCFRLL